MHVPGLAADAGAEVALPALLLGQPSSSPQPSPELSRFSEDVEDPTRLHIPLSDEMEEAPAPVQVALAPPGAPGIRPPSAAVNLSAFEEDDGPEGQTRINVPLSYDDEPTALAPPPITGLPPGVPPGAASSSVLPPPVATPVVSIPPHTPVSLPGPYDGTSAPPDRRGILDGFGQDMLQLSLQIDPLLKSRRTLLLGSTVALAGVVAPLLDALIGSQLEVATVLSSNILLFVLWLFAFAWTGRRRNDNGHWDASVVFSRLLTHHKLVWREIANFDRLPAKAKFLTLSELLMPLGIVLLGLASAVSISRTVWGWPGSTASLFFVRFVGSAIVLLALLARHQSALQRESSQPTGLDPSASATKHFPAILDLERPLPSSPGQTNSSVREVIQALSLWPAREWPNLDSYRLAIHRHLVARLPWASFAVQQRAPGTRREDAPDLVVNGTVLVRLRRGFDNSVPLAATSQMQSQTRGWGVKPTLLVLFETPMSVLTGPSTTALEGLHRTHPILVLRMPAPEYG